MEISELKAALCRKYGDAKGQQIFNRVMPGIFADFHKMIISSKGKGEIRETYRFEDETSAITVVCKDRSKQSKIEFFLEDGKAGAGDR